MIYLTLKELREIHRPRKSGDQYPSITLIIIQNLFTFTDIGDAKLYLRQVFEHELAEVMDTSNGMKSWAGHLQFLLRDNIERLEGAKKSLRFRKYLSDLSNLDVMEYLQYISAKPKNEEYLFINEAAIMLKRSQKMIRNYINEGKLESIKDKAKRTIIPKSSVDAFMKGL